MSEATPARHWVREGDRVVCEACPRRCRLAEGQSGFCRVRQNEAGRLVSLVYGRPSAVAVDPIEKKPLFHFLPGSSVLSLGTVGCNLSCQFCQNASLSRGLPDASAETPLPPDRVAGLARAHGCASVAFTYNEPTVFLEYAVDTARQCREAGVATVGITAGYIGRSAREELYPLLDAANIDLKAFDEGFYRSRCGARLDAVLETIEYAVKAGVFVELTTLLVPGENDGDEELRAEARWVGQTLGRDVPLHFSAFHPAHRMMQTPPTPASTLRRARDLALAEGLRFVYTGNVADPEGATTRCPGCGAALINREWHAVKDNLLVGRDTCPFCATRIPGVFDSRSHARSSGRYGLP